MLNFSLLSEAHTHTKLLIILSWEAIRGTHKKLGPMRSQSNQPYCVLQQSRGLTGCSGTCTPQPKARNPFRWLTPLLPELLVGQFACGCQDQGLRVCAHDQVPQGHTSKVPKVMLVQSDKVCRTTLAASQRCELDLESFNLQGQHIASYFRIP